MLKFKRVKATNYLSIREVELELDNQGLVLVEGVNDTNDTFQSNGSGKSSLLSTVTYALYGMTPNGLKADSVINNHAGKNLAVILEFEKDNVPYRIERYRKHSKHKNTVKFYQGDTDLTQKSVADTDKKILSVFGIDYLTYMNSIMYGQGNVEIFAKTTDKGKKEILENLADISVYRYAQEIAKEKAKTALEQVENYKREQALQEQSLQFLQDSYERAKQEYETVEHMLAEQNTRYAVESANLAQSMAELADYEPKTLQEIERLKSAPMLAMGTIDPELQDNLQQAQENVNKLVNAQAIAESKIQENQRSLKKLETETNCYVCGAPLNTEHRETEMARLQTEIEQQSAYSQQIASALPTYQQAVTTAREQINLAQQDIAQVSQKNQEITNKIYQLQTKLTEKKTAVSTAQVAVNGIQSTINQLQAVPKPALDQEKVQEITTTIEQLQQQQIECKNDYEQYTTLANQVFSNSGIRSVVLDLITPFLNERANHYLGILAGSDIEILFSTQSVTASGKVTEKFDLEIINGSGGSTYQANSEGEKKRIDLAISFAIQDLVQSKANLAVNFGLYDECFDGLDSIGCENVIRILQERQKEVGSIFVITHNIELKALFEKVITMKKENGESVLVEKKAVGKTNESA